MDTNIDDVRVLLVTRLGKLAIALIAIVFASTGCFYFISDQMGSGGFAMLAAALGAITSFARRFPTIKSTEARILSSSHWHLLLPVIIGSIMGLIIFLVFMAGVLTGDSGGGLFTSNLFPNFSRPTSDAQKLSIRIIFDVRPDSVKDFGKLMIWCFLSGYSERLVPRILEKLEQQTNPIAEGKPTSKQTDQ